MFHDVGPGVASDPYVVTPARLREALAVVREPARVPLSVTFDDGHLGTFEHGLPALQEAGVVSTLFATTGFVGRPGFMDPGRIRRWVEAGQLLGSHAVTHRPLSLMPEAEAVAEMRESRERLEDWIGRPVAAFAFPGGNDSPRLRRLALDAGFEHVYTSEPAFATAGDRILGRFTIRGTTSVAAVAALAAGRRSTPFLADAARYRLKRLVGAGAYRRARSWLRRPGGGGDGA